MVYVQVVVVCMNTKVLQCLCACWMEVIYSSTQVQVSIHPSFLSDPSLLTLSDSSAAVVMGRPLVTGSSGVLIS